MKDLSGQPLIVLKGVTKIFGEGQAAVEALRGVDLRIDTGEFVAVMGAQRVRQVHLHEHPGLPGYAHCGKLPVQRR